MITIYYQGHANTADNEAGVASGHHDVELSESGRVQARDVIAPRYADVDIDAVFCSDLRRAYETAQIVLEGREIPITKDARLRECDYGDLTRHPRREVGKARTSAITQPFPNGESFEQVAERVSSFLADVRKTHDGQTILIIGHSATYWGLRHLIDETPLTEAIQDHTPFARFEMAVTQAV